MVKQEKKVKMERNGENGNMKTNVTKREFFINYEKAEKNYFTEAARASGFILGQLTLLEESNIFNEGFCWSGSECMVPAGALNSVLRLLEREGLQEMVVIFPSHNETGGKNYIIKPCACSPDVTVNKGIVVSLVKEKEIVKKEVENMRYKRSLERVLDKLYGDILKDFKGASINKFAHNEDSPFMEMKYDICFKSEEDAEKFSSILCEKVSGLKCSDKLKHDTICEYNGNYILVKFISWESGNDDHFLKECNIVKETADLVGMDFKEFDFNKDLEVLSDNRWLWGKLD